MKNILIILTLVLASTGYVYSQVNSDTVNTDVLGGGGGGGGLSVADIDTIAEFNAIIAPDVVDISSSQTLTNKLIDGNGNTVKMLRHATDCTTFTGAFDGEYCWEKDSNIIYVCETAATCDTAEEWIPVATFASSVANTPAGNIAATDAQAAIDELDTEKVAKAGDTLTGNLLIDNQKEVRLLEADANGSNYFGFNAPASLSGDLTLTWNVTPGNCTGDGNAGCLTVNGSNEIVCSADDGGAGGAGDITDVGSCDNGACGTEGGTDIFPFIYEGTANTEETTFTVTEPATSDKTINFPNASGDVVLDVATQTLTNKTLAAADNVIQSDTALALDANPTDCSAGQYATTIAANGNLTCSQVTGAQVSNTPAGNIAATDVQAAIDELDTEKLATGANAVTATALASNPTDCSSNQFANAIAASGNLTCAAIADADVPDTITASNYLPLAGGTLTGLLTTDNLGVEFDESDTNPTCSSGNYNVYADLSETALKACNNGTAAVIATADNTLTLTNKTISAASNTLTIGISNLQSSTSADLAGVLSDEQGSGAVVFASSPTLTTPTLGVATASSINKVAITAPATSATLTIADGKTLTVSKTMTLTSAGDSAVLTFPNATATIPSIDSTSTLTNKSIDCTPGTNTCTHIPWASLDNVPAFRKTLLQFRPQQYIAPTSNYATLNTRDTTTPIPVLNFDTTTSECALWTFVLPNWYGGNGTTVAIWTIAPTATSGTVQWDVYWERVEATQDMDAVNSGFASAQSTSATSVSGTSGVPIKQTVAFTDGAQMDSCAAGEYCILKVCRNVAGDNLAEDASMTMLTIYETP